MSEEYSYDMPKSLRHSLKSFQMIRQRIRLNVNSPNVQNNGGVIRVQIPQGCLLDLNTFELSMDLTVTAPASPNNTYVIPPAHCFFTRVNPIINSVSTNASNNLWNQTAQAIWLSSCGQEFNKSNALGNYVIVPRTSGISASDQGSTIYANWFPQTLLSSNCILDTNIINSGNEIELITEGNNIFMVKDANSVVTGWSGANIRAYCDVLILPNTRYSDSQKYLLDKGETIRILCESSVATISTCNGANTFAVGSSCLDGVLMGVKAYNYISNSPQVSGDYESVNGSPYMKFDSGKTTMADGFNPSYYAYLQYNSLQFPAYGSENLMALSEYTRNYWGRNSKYNYNQLFTVQSVIAQTNDGSTWAPSVGNTEYDKTYYLHSNHVAIFPLCESPAVRNGYLTGINSLGNNSLITLRSNGYTDTNQNLLMLVGLCSSHLEVKAGGVVSFVQ